MNNSAGASRLAAVSRAGTAAFVVSVMAMHVVQSELSPWNDAVSYYMNGAWGWVLGAGLVAMGAGSLCLLAAIWREVRGSRAGQCALGLWGLGASIGGLFAPDPIGSWSKPPTFSGMMHGGAAMVAFSAFPAAAVTLVRGQSVRVVAWICVTLLVAFFATLTPVFINRPPYGLGATERLLLAGYVAWLWMAARR